ncbi:BTAD domain-containing putative transcriptional regulator [Phytoactinopolyspora limicola]|uniref:BTAD domain-containing putative transcriptional regulator n=1 Tax=Phytoactinopolyspora limicola TaxID=2715536 RepID=UPI00140CAF30|nr:BTAD domain-containing putative transcriptional regulator [Phytoactinopolyspora limicola]
MQIAVLGPLEVRAHTNSEVVLSGARLRTLLIGLALEPGRVVSTPRLIEAIWDEEPPTGAVNALQALVSRLRRALPDVQIDAHPAGYRLLIDPDAVDVARFEKLAAAGRSRLATNPAEGAQLLREALALWRGSALLDVAELAYFHAAAAHLTESRLAVLEDRISADLRLGLGGELLGELTALVAEHPRRERLVAALIQALAAAGRPAEALEVYERTRVDLAETLGADPSPELAAVHTAVLRGELSSTTRDLPAAPPDPDRSPRTNLRAGLTSFVGRDQDVDEVQKLVDEYRLVTLIGPGGAGKTRLSVEVGHTLADRAPDGVWLVELASLNDETGVPQAILTALNVRDQALLGRAAESEPIDRLVSALRSRKAVLVLDNCEHLIDAVAASAERLLGECPQLRILATSREPLGITGEAVRQVEPLELPPPDVATARALSYPAVRLLADRARAASAAFAVTDEIAPAVIRVCRALDGMPLAIELAAARLRTMTMQQLADRIDDRFRLLTSGSRTALARHKTLRAVIDWSWELLTDDERTLLRRLAVFSGGSTATAAARVCADDQLSRDQIPDLLAALVDKSLLQPGGDAESRYHMLDTIKAYGLERLEGAGEQDRIRLAHAAHFVELVETADPYLRGADQLEWLRRLDADHANIVAAIRDAMVARDTDTAVRMVASAGWYWWLRGYRAEATRLAAEALAMPGATDREAQTTAYAVAGLYAAAGLGDTSLAAVWATKVEEATGELGRRHPLVRLIQVMRVQRGVAPELLANEDPWVRGLVLINWAEAMVYAGRQHDDAEAAIRAAVSTFRDLGERWGISFSLTALADMVARRGDLVAAQAHYGEAVAALRAMGAVEDVPYLRSKQAQLLWMVGDHAGSTALMAEAQQEAEEVSAPDALAMVAFGKAELACWAGDVAEAKHQLARFSTISLRIDMAPEIAAMVLNARATVAALDGDVSVARDHLAQAFSSALMSTNALSIGQVLVGAAGVALRDGQPYQAAQLLAASTAIQGAPNLSRPDAGQVENAARAALGEEQFAEATQRGRAVTLSTVPELVATALDQ